MLLRHFCSPQRGLAKAERHGASMAEDAAAEQASASAGSRPAISLAPPLDPAEVLEAAEQLSQAHPSREAAKADRIEV